MAREHANIRLDMWGDADWRQLSRDAQWLYELLLTHPDTNRAGVSDWRPGRLAKMAVRTSPADIRRMGDELASRFFIVIDDETEEVAIRSYVKYDGVLKQPNLTITMANDWTGIASERIRAVIAFEVQRLRQAKPELPGWKSEQHLETLLSAPALNIRADPSADPKRDPSVDPSVKGQADPSVEGATTSTSTSTSTNASHSTRARKMKEVEKPLPADWEPSADHAKSAAERGLNLDMQAARFRAHADANGRKQVSWNGAFAQWLLSPHAKPEPAQAERKVKQFVAHND